MEGPRPPQILYWKWTDEIFNSGVLERKVDDICARSGFDTICVSFHWMEAGYFDPRLQDAVARASKRLVEHGRRLLLDIDIRTEGDSYVKRFPGEYSGFVGFLEVELDADGHGVGYMPAQTVHRFGRKRLTSVDRIEAGWAFRRRGTADYDLASLRDIRGACHIHLGEDGAAEILIEAGRDQAGKRVLLFPHFTHIVPDLFSPHLYAYFREMLEAARNLPLRGVAIDEWGHSPIFHFDDRGMHFREIAYSSYMDAAYQRRYGRRLCEDLLHLRYGPEETRLRVINQYVENLRCGMAENESWFYATGKEIFGPEAFIGTHSTWMGGPHDIYLEVLQNGLHWWEARRDFGQTDEATILPIRLALAHKAGGAVWYNMFYSGGTERLDTYFPETWGNARFGGRTHQLGYECPNERGVKSFADPGALEEIWRLESRIGRLNAFQQASPDSRVLVVFGMGACTNWEFAEEKSYRFTFEQPRLSRTLRFADELFASHLCDLVPSSEIVNGSLTWQEGRPRYGNQSFDAVILLEPDLMRPEVFAWFERMPDGFPFYVFGEARWLADASDATPRFASLRERSTWHAGANPWVGDVVDRLRADGVPSHRFGTGCVLQDGSLIFATDGKLAAGNELRVDVVHLGRRIEFVGEDFLALRLGKDGSVSHWVSGSPNTDMLQIDGQPVRARAAP